MKPMVLNKPGTPLVWTDLPDRQPGPGEIRVKVLACGVCRTDLHVMDGERPNPKSPQRAVPESAKGWRTRNQKPHTGLIDASLYQVFQPSAESGDVHQEE